MRRPASGISPALINPRDSHNLGGGEATKDTQSVRVKDNVIRVPDTGSVIHVDEIEHAPAVPELGAVVEIRPREDTTITFVPVVLRHDEPRVADLRGDKGKQNQLERRCVDQLLQNDLRARIFLGN